MNASSRYHPGVRQLIPISWEASLNMMRATRTVFLVLGFITALSQSASATDVYFSDDKAVSENGRFIVEGKSPDNAGPRQKPFASNFTYTLFDAESSKTIWTRKQGKDEAPCVGLFVNDEGWVVIRTGTYATLICVDPKGQVVGEIGLIKDVFTAKERQDYVHYTTAGPMWSGYSKWYFLKSENRNLFVIRPWWDRRIVIDLAKGRAVPVTDPIAANCLEHERQWVLSELRKAVATRKQWDHENGSGIFSILDAAYLAGKIRMREAIPLLSLLQDAKYSGASVWSGSEYEPSGEKDIDPSSWEELTARRVVHLSLRRLGVTPGPFDCTKFDNHVERINRTRPRAGLADDVQKGMRPRRILELIGAPDFNDSDEWHYAVDTSDPYTLTITWGAKGVKKITQTRPPIWTTERWDDEL